MKRLILLLMFLSFFYVEALALNLKGTTIHIVDDSSEWAPYTYYKRVGGKATKEIVGFSVDVIDAIFKKNGINYTIELRPWKRALEETQAGVKFHLILNASFNEERAAVFNYSIPYYTTTPHYFYSKANNPIRIIIKSKEDLERYKIGGIRGYNYIPYGVDMSKIDTDASDFVALIEKLKKGRFDIFLENLEPVVGYSTVAKNVLKDADLAYAPLTYLERAKFHMLMPKNEVGAELKKIIDEEISLMEKSGELNKILKKYFPSK
ncbi:MAG: amino acid ABC transporter substrate-binding protein [Oligoflexia bacterium]|nr:amino acid ABC transporter substrate-binding protein [Oligoflexia bacterium]